VGGDPRAAASAGAAFGLLLLSARWLDDVHDGDDSALVRRFGPARTTSAMGAHALAWSVLACDPAVPKATLRIFAEVAARMARDQDWDVRAPSTTTARSAACSSPGEDGVDGPCLMSSRIPA
jgi:hypothetical protein